MKISLSEAKRLGVLATHKKAGRTRGHKVEIDGYTFASKKESSVYLQFKADTQVEILEVAPEFLLFPSFKRASGRTIRQAVYTADFLIKKDGQKMVVEVKSGGTAKMTDYQLRRRLFLAKYPDLTFLEIILEGRTRKEKLY